MEPAKEGGETALLKKQKGDRDMDDYVEDCPVCMTAFDDTIQRPRNLPCGHTLCTPCIDTIKKHGQVTCPTCNVGFAVPETGQFPISYTIEGLIRRLRNAALTSSQRNLREATAESASSPVKEPGVKRPAGLSRKARSLVQEHETKVLEAIRTCQEVQAQLDEYKKTLAGCGDQQQHLEDQLQALIDQSKNARALVRQQESQAASKKEQLQQGEQQLHAMLQNLRAASTGEEVFKAIDDADHRTKEEMERVEECLGMFPDVHTIITITKVRDASNAALEAATIVQATKNTGDSTSAGAAGDSGLSAAQEMRDRTAADATKDSCLPAALGSNITVRLEAMLAPPLKVEDIRSLTQPARNLLQAGLVFAVHEVGGRNRHARICLKDGRQYIHCLQDQPLPPFAVTMQMDEVVPAAPPCLVFLDLTWPGSAPRRVFIRLSPDTPHGRQFLLLCTGQRGPCYAKTRLWKVGNKGQSGECVYGGDYAYNKGTGGTALLLNIGTGDYPTSSQVGAVSYVSTNHASGAQFAIKTRNGGDSVYVSGAVLEGLDVVMEAAQHSPIREVTVVDCGVVL